MDPNSSKNKATKFKFSNSIGSVPFIIITSFLCMAEAAYTVASDSETNREEKSSYTFPDTTIGIDLGTSQCRVAIWNGSQVEILKNSRNQKMMSSYVTFKDGAPSGEVSSQLSAGHEIDNIHGIIEKLKSKGRRRTGKKTQRSF